MPTTAVRRETLIGRSSVCQSIACNKQNSNTWTQRTFFSRSIHAENRVPRHVVVRRGCSMICADRACIARPNEKKTHNQNQRRCRSSNLQHARVASRALLRGATHARRNIRYEATRRSLEKKKKKLPSDEKQSSASPSKSSTN